MDSAFFSGWSSGQPDSSIIKSWYLSNDDPNDNPFEFLDLNDRIRAQLTSIKKKLPKPADKIIAALKAYYKAQPEKQQKSDLIYLKFLYEAQALLGQEKLRLDLDTEYPKFMPQIAEHFKPEVLQILEIDQNLHVANIFTELVNIDVLQNLDKESIQEQEKADISLKFMYESRLESIYTKIIIKMLGATQLSQGWQDMSTMINYLNQYPFRLLNKEGVQVPENFYLSAANFINKQLDKKEKAATLLHFFTVIDKIRSNKAGFKDKSDFITAFDAGATILRSINFREDFDYLNSLNVKGVKLNRQFWQILDEKIKGDGSKALSSFLKSAQTSKTIEDFYSTLESIGISAPEIKAEADRIASLCSETKQDKPDEVMSSPYEQAQPLTFSATEYNQLGLKGAKVMKKINNKFLAVENLQAAVIVGSSTNSKSRKDEEHKRVVHYDCDESKTVDLAYNIANDTDPKKVRTENYIACFFNQAFFDKEDLENFLQINYKTDMYNRRLNKSSSSLMDVEDEKEKIRRVMSASRKKGPISGIPREKIINHLEFVYVDVQNYTDMIVTVFDVCSMTKRNILEFIQDVTTTKSPTFYNIYYSLEDAQDEEDVAMLTKTQSMLEDEDQEQDQEQEQEQELLDRIGDYNVSLEERQQEIKDRLTQLKDEETQRILLEKDDDLSHLAAIAEKEKEADEKLDEVKAETARQLKEGQAELDKQKKVKTKNDAYLKFVKGKSGKELETAKEAFETGVTTRMDKINTLDEENEVREAVIKIFADKKRGYEKGLQFGKNKELEKIIVEAQQKVASEKYSNPVEANNHVVELKKLLEDSKTASALGSKAVEPKEVAVAAVALKQNLLDYNLASADAALATVKNVFYGDEENEDEDNTFKVAADKKKKRADAAFKTLIENYEVVNNWLCRFYNNYTKNKDVFFFKEANFTPKQVDEIITIKGLNVPEPAAASPDADAAATALTNAQVDKLVEIGTPMTDGAKVLAEKFNTSLTSLKDKLNTLAKKEEAAKELRVKQTCPQGYEKTDAENWCFNEKLLEKLKEGYTKIKKASASNDAAAKAKAAAEKMQKKGITAEEAAAAATAAAQLKAEAERIAAELKKTPFEQKQARNAAAAAARAAAAEERAKAAKASEKPKFELTKEQTDALLKTRLERGLDQGKESIPAIIANIAQKCFKINRRSSPDLTLEKITEQIKTQYSEPISTWVQTAVTSLAEFNALPTKSTNAQYSKLFKKIKKIQESISSTVKYENDGVLEAINKEGTIEIDISKANTLLEEMKAGVDALKELVPKENAS